MAMTVSECIGIYVAALNEQADAEREAMQDKNKGELAPHLADQAQADIERALAEANAYNSLPPTDKLALGKMLYG